MSFFALILLSVFFLFPVPCALAGEALTLSVQQAGVLALENNKNILISRQAVLAALGEVKAERGKFDPVFEVNSSYDSLSEPSASSLVSGGIETRRFAASMGLTGALPSGAYYDLFRFSVSREKSDSPIQSLSPAYSSSLDMRVGHDLLRNFGSKTGKASIVAQSLQSDITRLDLIKGVSDVLFEVENRYWNLVVAERQYGLVRQNLDLGIDLLERNRIKVREGVLTGLDEMKAESEVAALRVELIEAENEFRNAGDRLKNLLGLPLDGEIEPTDVPTVKFHGSLDISELMETAFENRAELKQAAKRLRIVEERRNFRSNQKLPRLSVEGVVSLRGLAGSRNPDRLIFQNPGTDLSVFGGGFSESVSRTADADFVSWGASVKMSVPIGNRSAAGIYEAAEAEVNKAVVEYGQTKEAIALEVKEARDRVWSGYRRTEASETSARLATEVLETEKEKYSAGLSTTREVLEAQRDLAEAQSIRIRSLADYRTALAALKKAIGTISDSIDIPKGL